MTVIYQGHAVTLSTTAIAVLGFLGIAVDAFIGAALVRRHRARKRRAQARLLPDYTLAGDLALAAKAAAAPLPRPHGLVRKRCECRRGFLRRRAYAAHWREYHAPA